MLGKLLKRKIDRKNSMAIKNLLVCVKVVEDLPSDGDDWRKEVKDGRVNIYAPGERSPAAVLLAYWSGVTIVVRGTSVDFLGRPSPKKIANKLAEWLE